MKSGLLEFIKKQSSFGFIGRINILEKKSNQYVGVICLKDHEILSANFQASSGRKAFYSVFLEDIVHQGRFIYVSEPDTLSDISPNFSITNFMSANFF